MKRAVLEMLKKIINNPKKISPCKNSLADAFSLACFNPTLKRGVSGLKGQ